MELSLANVINVSIAAAQAGVGEYNTSNIALFTRETPGETFGDDLYKIYLSPADVATDFGTSSVTYKMAVAVFSQQPNILNNSGYLVVIPFADGSEDLDTAILRTVDLVQYFAIMAAELIGTGDMLDAAASVQALNKMLMIVSKDPASVETGGQLDLLRTGNLHKTRGLFYGADEDVDALVMMAAYAGRGFSTNFNGSNTTSTMHLKDLIGVQPDPLMTQNLLDKSIDAGADTYPSLQGVPKVFCSGANHFFDQVYNLEWLVGALTVAGFNYLAQSATKVPQTEDGMNGLKGAYRKVCQQGITNQYLAPGSWTSPDTFGDLTNFLQNIAQVGFYIFSSPISQQSVAARAARDAPLIQIAVKEAGAIHKSNVIVFINA